MPDVSATFTPNLAAPVHRWFRYSAGFSAAWVREVLLAEQQQGRTRALDPFAGSGTVVLEGEACGMEAVGVEAHPFIARIARAKLLWRSDPDEFRGYAFAVLQRALREGGDIAHYPPLIRRCYPADTLLRLDGLRRAWLALAVDRPCSELTWLCLASILRETAHVGTAQWQYVLPNKTRAHPADPFEAFAARINLMRADMRAFQRRSRDVAGVLHEEDARACPSVPDGWADLVITSPPYANNYDYADATRLEMSFFGEVQGWGDLQAAVRRHLVRSCTQHVARSVKSTYDTVDAPLLAPIRDELRAVCLELDQARAGHGGNKPYHTMIAGYFHDLAQVWQTLRRVTQPGRTRVCFVIGDSAPYGVYVPVDAWLGRLALAAGFETVRFEKLRDRNVKWHNRKHRVPLREGRLWVEG